MANVPTYRQGPLAPRKGERASATIARRTLPDGTQTVTQVIDLSTASPPDRVYYARETWVEYQHGIVSLIFAQKKREGDAIRSMVIVNMPPQAIVQWVRSVDNMSNPGVAEIMNQMDIKAEEPKRINGEADQVIELTANFPATSVSGADASMDFYKASPHTLARARTGKQIELEAQVRVDMRTSLFAGLIESLRREIKNFPESVSRDLPEEE